MRVLARVVRLRGLDLRAEGLRLFTVSREFGVFAGDRLVFAGDFLFATVQFLRLFLDALFALFDDATLLVETFLGPFEQRGGFGRVECACAFGECGIELRVEWHGFGMIGHVVAGPDEHVEQLVHDGE